MNATTIRIGNRNIDLHERVDNLPDLACEHWHESATGAWENGSHGVYQWDLGGGQYLYVDTDQGIPQSAGVSQDDIDDHLLSWSYDDQDAAEWLAAWSLDGLSQLDEVDDTHDGPCRIWCEPCYYSGTYNAPTPGYVRDDAGAIAEFDTYADAAEYVDAYYNTSTQYDGVPDCNIMSHGQAGPDSLTIVKS